MTTETESVELVWGLQTLHWSGVAQSDCRLFCHVSKFVFAKLDEAAAFFPLWKNWEWRNHFSGKFWTGNYKFSAGWKHWGPDLMLTSGHTEISNIVFLLLSVVFVFVFVFLFYLYFTATNWGYILAGSWQFSVKRMRGGCENVYFLAFSLLFVYICICIVPLFVPRLVFYGLWAGRSRGGWGWGGWGEVEEVCDANWWSQCSHLHHPENINTKVNISSTSMLTSNSIFWKNLLANIFKLFTNIFNLFTNLFNFLTNNFNLLTNIFNLLTIFFPQYSDKFFQSIDKSFQYFDKSGQNKKYCRAPSRVLVHFSEFQTVEKDSPQFGQSWKMVGDNQQRENRQKIWDVIKSDAKFL